MGTREQSKHLMIAARQGKLEGETGARTLVSELLKMQVDLDFNEKPFFRPAMWEATWKNHEAIVKLLVEKGAQVNYADYEGRTALHEAAYYGHTNLVEYLLDKNAEIDCEDMHGQTPLFRAVQGSRHDVVSLLVQRGAKTNRLDGEGVTIQHVSAFNGEPHMAWWLYYKGAWKNRFGIQAPDKPKEEEKKEDDGAASKKRGSNKGEEGEKKEGEDQPQEGAEKEDP